jgi:hypothetical protein
MIYFPKVKSIIRQMVGRLRRFVWAFIVAYMLGMHNFYWGDTKTRDDIVITIENQDVKGDSSPA